jgi:fatty-acyl-CoA synthase
MLADLLRHWARWQPDAVAVRYHGADTTWRELDRRTDALAAGLAAQGVGKGDRVGLLLLNRPEFIDTVLAAWKLGALAVPMNVRYTAPEVAYVVDDADCAVVVGEEALAAGLADLGDRRVLMAESLAEHHLDTAPPAVTVGRDDPATICYTSGTTGDPKGAVGTHGAWHSTGSGWILAVGYDTDDRILLPFPLAFTGGFAVWIMAFSSGARLVLERTFDPDRSIELLAEEAITAFLAVPAVFQALVDHPRWNDVDLSAWRVASSGGAVVPPSLLRAVQDRGVPMLQSYTLTEASAGGTLLPSREATTRVGSAGIPFAFHDVRIADDDGNVLAPGEAGEIQLRGPSIMSGYWNKPEANAETLLPGGWLRTGDIGVLDDDGYLSVVDRAKDMLISGGLNVYPAEIERVITGLPGIVEVAVIGVPDDRWGETPAVIAVTDGSDITGDQILEACAGRLADFKLPRYLVTRAEPLPRNMSGKVLKRELRGTYADLPSQTAPIR